MKRFALSTVVMVCLVLAASAQKMALAGDPAVRFAGGGLAQVTDTEGVDSPVSFGIAGSVAADGSVTGGAKFLFKKPFARDWGAVAGIVDLVSLDVEFTGGTIAEDGSIVLGGEWVETDYSFGEGVVFVEEDTELTSIFELVVAPDGESFTLKWCELPTFDVEVPRGMIRVH